MGHPKLLLPFQDKSLLRHVINQCLKSRVDGLIVVVNPLIEALVKEANVSGVDKVILNECTNEGMSTSVIAGLRSLPKTVKSAIFLLGDQPLMTSTEINSIIDDYFGNQNYSIFQATYQGVKGHPVLFKRKMFLHLLSISGDEGGKSIIKRFEQDVYFTEMGREVIPDVDTPMDYQLLIEKDID
jgi:molybdenum cofactor cytidylyltransferase